jgi:hypothetical protein
MQRLQLSSPFPGQPDGESAAAEVDHRDEGGGAVVSVAAMVDGADRIWLTRASLSPHIPIWY